MNLEYQISRLKSIIELTKPQCEERTLPFLIYICQKSGYELNIKFDLSFKIQSEMLEDLLVYINTSEIPADQQIPEKTKTIMETLKSEHPKILHKLSAIIYLNQNDLSKENSEIVRNYLLKDSNNEYSEKAWAYAEKFFNISKERKTKQLPSPWDVSDEANAQRARICYESLEDLRREDSNAINQEMSI